MEYLNAITIDDSMKTALLEWIRQFREGTMSWPELMDGVVLNKIMNVINPDHVPMQKADSKTNNSCETGTLQAWTHLVNSILNFYQNSLQYLVFVKPPDVQLIFNDPCSEGALRQVEMIALMMLGCAVQCDNKKRFVEQIRSMDSSHHPSIVRCIKEITDRPDNFVHISQISSDKFLVISQNLRNFTQARQDLMARVMELTLEVNSLKDSKVGTKKQDSKWAGVNEEGKSSGDELKNLLEAQTLRLKELQNQLDERAEQLDDVQSELERHKRKVASLEQQNLALTQEASTARTYRDELEAANEKVSKFTQLEKKYTKLQKKLSDLDFWKQHASYLSDENDKLGQMKEQLEREVDALKDKYDRIKFYEAEIARCSEELQEMSEARQRDRDLIRELSCEKTKLEIEISNLQAANKSFTSESYEFSECQNMTLFNQLEKSNFNRATRDSNETAKLDESFATLYDLDHQHTGDHRHSISIKTGRLIDIEGTRSEAAIQTEDINMHGKDGSRVEEDDSDEAIGGRKSWKMSDGEKQINDTVENLFMEIQKLKDFVKLKDASILLMKMKVDEKTQECEQLMGEVKECKKNHQFEIDRLKGQSLSEISGAESLRSENKSLKSRLASAQMKIEGLKQERERIQQELNSFNEKVTRLIIENNRLTAQHEASVMVCGKVEDENVKLLDQLRDTLNKNQDLLMMILENRDHHAEEQKNYIEQLSELKYGKEKLEEKILEHLRKKEKKNLGIGTLVKKIKNKNKPTKSEQFLMSLESSNRLSIGHSFDRSHEKISKGEDSPPNPVHASTPSLVPPKAPRNRGPKSTFSDSIKNSLSHNKRLFQSEMNVSSFPDKRKESESSTEKSTPVTEDHDAKISPGNIVPKVKCNKQPNDNTCSDHQTLLKDETAWIKPDENQKPSEEMVKMKQPTKKGLDGGDQINISDTKDVNKQYAQENKKDDIAKVAAGTNLEDFDGDNDCSSSHLSQFKGASEDLRMNDQSLEKVFSGDDDVTGVKEKSRVKKLEKDMTTDQSESPRFIRDTRSTSVPDAPELSCINPGDQLTHDSINENHPVRNVRAFSEWNIHSPKVASSGAKLKSSVQSAFSAAGRKIVREMSLLKQKVTSKDSNKTKTLGDSLGISKEQMKSKTLTSDWKHGAASARSVEARNPHKEYEDCLDYQKLTFYNLAERRPAKIDAKTEIRNDVKKEVAFNDNVEHMESMVLAKPQRKATSPPKVPLKDETSVSSSSSTSSVSEEIKSPESNFEEIIKPTLSSSSSSSSSLQLPYKESKVCI